MFFAVFFFFGWFYRVFWGGFIVSVVFGGGFWCFSVVSYILFWFSSGFFRWFIVVGRPVLSSPHGVSAPRGSREAEAMLDLAEALCREQVPRCRPGGFEDVVGLGFEGVFLGL